MPTQFKKQKVMSICLSTSEGGLEFCVIRFAKKLQSEGHESIVVCLKNSSIEAKAKACDLKVISINKKNILFRFITLSNLIKNHNPDILISHRSLGIKISALFKIFNKNLKLVSFIHTLMKFSKKDFFHKYLYSKIDEFVVFTEIQKQNALHFLPIRENQIKIIPHYVNTELFSPISKKYFFEEDSSASHVLTIGCVGRFDYQKGQLELVEAARLLKNKNINFNLIFIGKDTKSEEGVRSQCEKITQKYGLTSQVQFYDHQNSIADFYKKFDLFVMPSYEETFGLVLIEAMASGCLCISTHAGGPVEILDYGKAGVLVAPRSAEDLAMTLEKIIKNPKEFKDIQTSSLQRVRQMYSEKNIQFSQTLF